MSHPSEQRIKVFEGPPQLLTLLPPTSSDETRILGQDNFHPVTGNGGWGLVISTHNATSNTSQALSANVPRSDRIIQADVSTTDATIYYCRGGNPDVPTFWTYDLESKASNEVNCLTKDISGSCLIGNDLFVSDQASYCIEGTEKNTKEFLTK